MSYVIRPEVSGCSEKRSPLLSLRRLLHVETGLPRGFFFLFFPFNLSWGFLIKQLVCGSHIKGGIDFKMSAVKLAELSSGEITSILTAAGFAARTNPSFTLYAPFFLKKPERNETSSLWCEVPRLFCLQPVESIHMETTGLPTPFLIDDVMCYWSNPWLHYQDSSKRRCDAASEVIGCNVTFVFCWIIKKRAVRPSHSNRRAERGRLFGNDGSARDVTRSDLAGWLRAHR